MLAGISRYILFTYTFIVLFLFSSSPFNVAPATKPIRFGIVVKKFDQIIENARQMQLINENTIIHAGCSNDQKLIMI